MKSKSKFSRFILSTVEFLNILNILIVEIKIQLFRVAALKLLFEYLTDSPVAPFQQEFVENDSPISSEVSYDVLDNSRTTFYFEFESVSEKDLKRVQPAMEQTLTTQVMQFDIDRMNDIIQKNYQEVLSSMENTPHESIACAVIIDFLYNGSDEKVKVSLSNA